MIFWITLLAVSVWAQDPILYLYQKKDWAAIDLQLHMQQKQSQRRLFQKLEELSAKKNQAWSERAAVFRIEKELQLLTTEETVLRQKDLEFACIHEAEEAIHSNELESLLRTSHLPLNCRNAIKVRLSDLAYIQGEK